MTAPEPIGSAWHFTTVHCEDLSSPLHALSSCCLLLLITGNLRTTHVQINIPTCGRREEKTECNLMGVYSSRFQSLNFRLGQVCFFASLLLFIFCLFVLCGQHHISRPADRMLTAGLSPLNTHRLASSASSMRVHVLCLCVCVESLLRR